MITLDIRYAVHLGLTGEQVDLLLLVLGDMGAGSFYSTGNRAVAVNPAYNAKAILTHCLDHWADDEAMHAGEENEEVDAVRDLAAGIMKMPDSWAERLLGWSLGWLDGTADDV